MIRLLVPLTATDDQIEEGLRVLERALTEVHMPPRFSKATAQGAEMPVRP